MKLKYGIKPRAPMLIYRAIAPQIETKERMAIVALATGHGTHEHYQLLEDVYNLLRIAMQAPGREYMKKVTEPYGAALKSVQDRFVKFGKFGMNHIDRKILTDMINTSADFWIRQPTELYMVCDAELRKYYGVLSGDI